ncbi:properdin-like isoform X2 [Crassostrea virginica]
MTQVHALLVLSVVQFVTVNAICKSCLNDEDCVDFCKDIHAKSVCENKFYDDSQSKCCVCMGHVRRPGHSPCSSDSQCTTHHCHTSHEKPYCDHSLGHCECAHCLTDSDCSAYHCQSGAVVSFCYNRHCLCDRHGVWSTWSSWSGCSGTCGTGYIFRQRHCSSLQCDGHPSEARPCHHHTSCPPVNGGWTHWAAWHSCSHTCGDGTSIRTRTCSNPVPQHGGHYCQGHSDDSKACNNGPCPVDGGWSGWHTWGRCSAGCGSGVQTRLRSCNNPQPAYGGRSCPGSEKETQSCVMQPCPVNGGWTHWSAWHSCSHTCGDGTSIRTRTCSNPVPQHGGHPCQGHSDDSKACNNGTCPVDGGWTDWTAWSSCLHTCGRHSRSHRTRTCSNPAPLYGGHPCPGLHLDSKACNIGPCPVDGGWTDWTAWYSCSHTCGDGTSFRARTCSNPAPQYGGNPCQGHSDDSKACNNGTCPGLVCPSCDDSLNCVFNNTCDSSETCMIRSHQETQFSVHCLRKDDCTFMQTALPHSEIYCCDDRDCIRQYLGV